MCQESYILTKQCLIKSYVIFLFPTSPPGQLLIWSTPYMVSSLYGHLMLQMYTPLHAASSSGQVNVVKLLLQLRVEVDAVNAYGNTSLHVSCLNGEDLVVSELIAFGAVLSSHNYKGQVGRS